MRFLCAAAAETWRHDAFVSKLITIETHRHTHKTTHFVYACFLFLFFEGWVEGTGENPWRKGFERYLEFFDFS